MFSSNLYAVVLYYEKLYASKLNTDLNGFKVVFKSGTITIPDGSSQLASAVVNFSDVVPDGYVPYVASLALGQYLLPYQSPSSTSVRTWIYVFSSSDLSIYNTAAAWTNYQYYLTLICKKR